MRKPFIQLGFILALGLAAGGCASRGGVGGAQGSATDAGLGGSDPGALTPGGQGYAYAPGQPGAPGGPGAGGPGAVGGGQNVVYFDFDSAEVRPDYRPVVENHARYLVAHPTESVILDGHTDERGTREYNIGLGERRGESVRQLMSVYGVAPQQVRVVSYGEERPAVAGSDEGAYLQNRRVEITYY